MHEPRRPGWKRWLYPAFLVCFWLAFAAATLGLMPEDDGSRVGSLSPVERLLISPLMLAPLWFALNRFRPGINRLVGWIPLPPLIRFLVAGLLVGVCLAANFAIYFNVEGTDMHPDPLSNTLLYFGIYGGVMLGWYLLRFRYRFGAARVFWLGGGVLALFEQNHLVPFALLGGDLVGAMVLLAYLIPIYGVPFASPFLIVPPRDLPGGTRRPGWGGNLLMALVPLLTYNLGGLLWNELLRSALGIEGGS